MTEVSEVKKPKVKHFDGKSVPLAYILKPIYFVVFATLLEMVNFLWLRFHVTGQEAVLQVLPKYFLLDLAVYLFAAAIIFLVPRVWGNVVFYLFLGFQVCINMINATLYKVFGDIFSFDMMRLGNEAVAAFKFEFLDFWSIVVNLLILGGIITIQVLLDRKLKKEVTLTSINKKALLLISFFALCLGSSMTFYCQTLGFSDPDTAVRVCESDKYLWENMHFKLEAYKKFGTYGFYLKSLADMVYNDDDYSELVKTDLLQDIEDGQRDADISATLYGDNCIVLMLESFEWYAIDPINTPTLWKIRTQTGVAMENFHAKNKTNVSEDIGLLGNMPKDTSMISLARDGLLDTPYTLANLFKSQGYQANFFHGYKKTFYDRDVVNKAMGFDNVYGVEDAEMEDKSEKFYDWNLDYKYIEAMIDKFIPEDGPFFSWFTTVSTHGHYDTHNDHFEEFYQLYDSHLDEYKAWMAENTPYTYPTDEKLARCYRQYKCAAMDTDKVVEVILNALEERGIANNTTLIMYADHNCYYEDLCYAVKGTSKDEYYDIYNYNVPFMIYSPRIHGQVNNEFCNTYDVYPTICQLFGLPYNTNLTHGYNVFTKDIRNSVMVSYLTGAFNQYFYTLNIVDMHTVPSATQAQLQRFKRNACQFYERQHDIEMMYRHGLLVA